MLFKLLYNDEHILFLIDEHDFNKTWDLFWDKIHSITGYEYEYVYFNDDDNDSIKVYREYKKSNNDVSNVVDKNVFKTAWSKLDKISIELPERDINSYIIDSYFKEEQNVEVDEKVEIVEVDESAPIEDVYGTKRWFKDGKLHRDGDKPAIVYKDWGKCWYKDGRLHRDGDKPAIVYKDGGKRWYKDGRLHRENGPAYITARGDKLWYLKGELSEEAFNDKMNDTQNNLLNKEAIRYICDDRVEYRTKTGVIHRGGDKPAVEYRSGTKQWYKDGKLHRDGDKPAIVCADGDKYWYLNGKLHRDGDKPAYKGATGCKCWYVDGVRHRENGPAHVYSNGNERWYLNGNELSEKAFNEKMKMKVC